MEISWIAVLVAAAAKFILGALWYTALFGKQWRQLQGVPEGTEVSGLAPRLVVDAIASLVMAYILARFIVHYGPPSFGEGLLVGSMAWLGLVATVTLTQVLYEGKPWALWFINNGYFLLSLLIMGAILGLWHAGGAVPTPAA